MVAPWVSVSVEVPSKWIIYWQRDVKIASVRTSSEAATCQHSLGQGNHTQWHYTHDIYNAVTLTDLAIVEVRGGVVKGRDSREHVEYEMVLPLTPTGQVKKSFRNIWPLYTFMLHTKHIMCDTCVRGGCFQKGLDFFFEVWTLEVVYFPREVATANSCVKFIIRRFA